MLGWLKRLLRHRRKHDPNEVKTWRIVVKTNGGRHVLGEPFQGTLREAQCEASERAEIFMAGIVFKTGDVAFAQYGCEEVTRH
jgi:hypothetical protein